MRHFKARPAGELSFFRRLALAAWDDPRDPSIHGTLELDATAALAHLETLHARTGERATLTHLVGRALAVVLSERPELHVLVRRGRLYPRAEVDIFFQVARADEHGCDLTGLVIRGADRKSITDIAREFGERLEQVRRDCDPQLGRTRRRLAALPPALLRPLQAAQDLLRYRLDLRVPGLPRDPFGSAAVTNLGMFGVRWAYAPLFPPAHWPILLLVGAVTPRPWIVEDDGEPRVAVRPVLPLHATLDHRVLDGVQAAGLSARIEELLLHPELLELPA
ncbi:pyruvate dehydrogenase E2 component (dihydrolipoamide acetyltransferase) [Nannocystis exedens]|uniref:Pyruvate dehydrogenase E2 component (Dihydrolipoamide acetyltransferase) n=1 Tax=Nannocystis exedens TaxID=54 RepID=A0A1I2HMG0_9BACT|nr:2-oxo acid dehydrogenase subunit E2 [Nannocystis exedens]PCC71985.1 branched-chain alpha-keto acid dehydrogenase subunit E2 [Nannocystis exedens]SFF30480.1 pyruvate dehydrogenase E2 component (dihydrolipoamide acetyltransferase) [Nannocystis exedens]